jgi:hypothetical protein
MKVAVFSESSADEAGIGILAQALLGHALERADLPSLRTRGWPSVRQVLPAVLMALHYQTDAQGLVVIVDSDLSPVHLPDHDTAAAAAQGCRLCQLQQVVATTRSKLRPVPNRAPLRVALGLAVPSLEAWWRCGIDAHVTEAAWLVALQSRRFPYDVNRLKVAVYGTDRPGLDLETVRMTEEATRVALDLARLETGFPNGFGPFAREIRGW